MSTTELEIDNYTLQGSSIAGKHTAIVVPQLKICFDMGYVPPSSLGVNTVFISHGHNDHISALNLHLRQRRLSNQYKDPVYIMPKICHEPYKLLYSASSALDNGTSKVTEYAKMINFKLLSSDRFMETNYNMTSEHSSVYIYANAYPTVHRVQSFGYTIYEKRRKLRPEFLNLPGHEIGQLKNERPMSELFYELVTPIVSFTGDTTIEGILNNHDFLRSNILIAECTYLQDIDREKAYATGHTHILDYIENADKFVECKNLVLSHLSARYFDNHESLSEHVPKLLEEIDFDDKMKATKVHIFG